MTLALPCIANPASYAGAVDCPIYCTTGEPSFTPTYAQDLSILSGKCGTGTPDSVCTIRCAGMEPKIEVVPEPSFLLTFSFGLLLLAGLTQC